MSYDPGTVGTIAQWAAPFITFGLSFLGRRKGEGRRSREEQPDGDIDAQVQRIVPLLGERRVYLLKRMERCGRPIYPQCYAAALAAFDGSSTSAGDGWREATRYACAYLSALGLVEYRGTEVVISDLGRAVLMSTTVRAEFHEALTKASA